MPIELPIQIQSLTEVKMILLDGHYESVSEGERESEQLAGPLPHTQDEKPDDTHDNHLVNFFLNIVSLSIDHPVINKGFRYVSIRDYAIVVSLDIE